MAAAVEHAGDPGHVYNGIGPEADPGLVRPAPMQEQSTVDALRQDHLAGDSLQVVFGGMIGLHGIIVDFGNDQQAVQIQAGLSQTDSHQLMLQEGLLKKDLPDDPGVIEAEAQQAAGFDHGLLRSIGVAEHTCIRHHAHIQGLGDPGVRPLFLQHIPDQLTGAARVSVQIAELPGPRVADMVVDVDGKTGIVKYGFRSAKSLLAAVQRDESVIGRYRRRKIETDGLRSGDIAHQSVCKRLQIDIHLCLRHIFAQVQGHAHAGSHTVPVRVDMAADGDGLYAFQFLQYIHNSSLYTPV